MSQTEDRTTRSLTPDDLETVVDIDRTNVGRSRRRFFEKRLEAALAEPDDFVAVGADVKGALTGFVFARVLGGEFGIAGRVATVDAIGVSPDNQSKGIGRALLDGMDARLRRKEVGEIRTQADWRFHSLLRFFDAMGFNEAPVHILERAAAPTEEEAWSGREINELAVDATLADYGDVTGADYGTAAGSEYREGPRDLVDFRSLRAEDIDAIARIDRRITGRNRRDYYEHKMREMLDGTGVRVSRVAEIDDDVVGVVMARIDYGEFGRAEPAAVMDTIDVDPGYRKRGVGRALMSRLLVDANAFGVETVRTTVPWNRFGLLAFLEACGFTPSQRMAFRRPVSGG